MRRATISPTRAPVLNMVARQRIVAAAVDGAAIDDVQDGFDLVVLEILHGAAGGPLERDARTR